MAKLWSGARVRQVYHHVGKHSNGDNRYRRANFELIKWDSDGDGVEEVYVNAGAPSELKSIALADTGQEHDFGAMFGHYELGIDIVDFKGFGPDYDSIYSLHAFGYY